MQGNPMMNPNMYNMGFQPNNFGGMAAGGPPMMNNQSPPKK